MAMNALQEQPSRAEKRVSEIRILPRALSDTVRVEGPFDSVFDVLLWDKPVRWTVLILFLDSSENLFLEVFEVIHRVSVCVTHKKYMSQPTLNE